MRQEELMLPENGVPAAAQVAAVGLENVRVATLAKQTDSDAQLLGHLLKMADDYRASQSLRQAIEMYFMLVDGYAETLQARLARERLLEIAEKYEHNGKLHHARAIYERLL